MSNPFITPEDTVVTGCVVPESCIESAEYIIRCIASGRLLSYSTAGSAQAVYAEFGDGALKDISNRANFHAQRWCLNLEDYAFGRQLPEVGQG
jgi:hypothetical protein